MEIITVGLDCAKAPVEVREKISFTPAKLGAALTSLIALENIGEAVILSTCNRVEVYVLSEHSYQTDVQADIRRFLANFHGVAEEDFASYLYYHTGRNAVQHLFEVASGIRSMVIGEDQIQGQVREAIVLARKHGGAGRVMDAFFRAAITTGKRARTETSISEHGVSVAFTAVELFKHYMGSLEGKKALVIGSGKTARLTAQVLLSNHVGQLAIANRTVEKGRILAAFLNTDQKLVYGLDHLEKALLDADVVISSTGAPHAIVTADMVARVMPQRADRPLYMVDIAVPRDIEREVAQLPGAGVWDIDDVKQLVDENIAKRHAEIEQVLTIVQEEIYDFMAWMGALAVVPTITTLRRHADEIRKNEINRLRASFGPLTDKQESLLNELTSRIVNKLLHQPTLRLKEAASSSDAGRYAEVVQHLFSLQGVSHEAN